MNATRRLSTFVLMATFTALAGCGGSGPSEPATPPDDCSGRFQCKSDGYGAGQQDLARDEAGRCMLAGLVLQPDGTAVRESTGWQGKWSRKDWVVSVCNDKGYRCLVCTDLSKPVTPGQCVGSPNSCSSQTPGSCSEVRGCYMESHVHWNGTLEYDCAGNPDSCSEFRDEDHCLEQGCRWE